MPTNTLLSGLTGQRDSGCFLTWHNAFRLPTSSIPASAGQQSPAATSFFTEQISAFRLRQPSVKAPSALVSILWLSTFRFLFLFSFYFFCSLFFLFFCFFLFFLLFFHILYHPIYRIFIFSVFFCGFLHEKTASITGCWKSSFFAFFVQKILCILILK